MEVIEIFKSIDGEGKRTGYVCTFVRFAGCNLRCNYCDTQYSYDQSNYRQLRVDQIVEICEELGTRRVTLTGGEPLLQPKINSLIDELLKKNYEVNIETNGAVDLRQFVRDDERLFFTMDHKCVSSGMNAHMVQTNYGLLQKKDVLKVVVQNRADLEELQALCHRLATREFEIYVSPVWDQIETEQIVEYLKENDLYDVRLQVQLHKIIWGKDAQGV